MKHIIILSFGRALDILGSIILIKVITTWLSREELGRYYLISSMVSGFSWIFLNPISTYVGRCIHEWNQTKRTPLYLKRFAQYTFLVGVGSMGLLFLNRNFLGWGPEISYLFLFILFGLGIAANELFTLFSSILNILNQRFAFVFLQNLYRWGGMGLAVLCVMWLQPRAEPWLLGFFLIQVVALLLAFFLLSRELRRVLSIPSELSTPNAPTDDAQTTTDSPNTPSLDTSFTAPVVFSFAWPFSISLIFGWLHFQGYRFALSATAGESFVGLFGAGFAIAGGLIAAYEGLFFQFYQPIFYARIANTSKEERSKAFSSLFADFLPTIIPVALYLAASAHWLVKLMASAKYQQAAHIVAWVALVEFVRLLTTAYYWCALSEKNFKYILLPRIIGGIVAPGLTYLLIPFTSPLYGTIIALFAANLCLLVGSALNIHRNFTIAIPWQRILKALLLSLPIPIAFAFLPPSQHATLLSTFVVLGISGVYLLFVLWSLSKHLLRLETVENSQ